MTNIVNLYKNKGETPLQALERLRKNNLSYKDEVLTYAGRLDPMAEGVLLVLVGEENKKREDYLHVDKEYRVEMLFGVETDTYDVLGLPAGRQGISIFGSSLKEEGKLKEFLKKHTGTFLQPYPPYSSKPVQGKPLFQWAREGRLNEIEIPKKEVTIFSCELLDVSSLSLSHLKHTILESIDLVKGDFRQKEILSSWNTTLSQFPLETSFQVAKIHVKCSSGTYMRSLVHRIGKELGTSAIALSIVRTKVGEYSIEQAER